MSRAAAAAATANAAAVPAVKMMLAHAKANLYEESLDYWRQLVCVDGLGEVKIHIETYHCALKSAVVVCQWDEVEAILDMMKVRRVFARHRWSFGRFCGVS